MAPIEGENKEGDEDKQLAVVNPEEAKDEEKSKEEEKH